MANEVRQMGDAARDMRVWRVQDFGEATADNAVWMFCENLDARDRMAVGNTCYLDFGSGMGRDTLKVERIE